MRDAALIEWKHYKKAKSLLPKVMSLNPVHRTLNALQCTYLSVGGMAISKYMLRHLLNYHGFKFRSKEHTLLLTMKQREAQVELCKALLEEESLSGEHFL